MFFTASLGWAFINPKRVIVYTPEDRRRLQEEGLIETVTPRMRATIDAASLCKMSDRGQITGAVLDGPLGFDNAVSLTAARTASLKSAVAGHADILLAPDLESGNMLAKQLEHLEVSKSNHLGYGLGESSLLAID